jgi:flavin reductase (DIM6/NTAB) family NADH-FMN oxidoreductase RutF
MDPAARKKALRLLSYGLCVATSRDEAGPAAGTITWISQSSFTPPRVMAAIKTDTALHRAIAASRIFAVHIVGKSQKDLATAFFRGAQPPAADSMATRSKPAGPARRCCWRLPPGLNVASSRKFAAAITPSLSPKSWTPACAVTKKL